MTEVERVAARAGQVAFPSAGDDRRTLMTFGPERHARFRPLAGTTLASASLPTIEDHVRA